LAQFSFLELLLRKRDSDSDSLEAVDVVLVSFRLARVGEGNRCGGGAVDAVRERVAGVVKPLLLGEELAGEVGGELESLRELALEMAFRKRSLRAIVGVVVCDDEGQMRVFVELRGEGDKVNDEALRGV